MAYKTDEEEIVWQEPAPLVFPPRVTPDVEPVEVPVEEPEKVPVPA